jgi:hypothetical protein
MPGTYMYHDHAQMNMCVAFTPAPWIHGRGGMRMPWRSAMFACVSVQRILLQSVIVLGTTSSQLRAVCAYTYVCLSASTSSTRRADGLHGPLIVQTRPGTPPLVPADATNVMFLQDWWHDSGNALSMRLNRYVVVRGVVTLSASPSACSWLSPPPHCPAQAL